MTEQQHTPQPRQGKGDPCTVRIFANKGPNGDWQFHMHQDNHPADQLTFSKDKKKLKKSDWHDISFVLEEPTDSLRFHPRKEEAIWVARGSATQPPACPTARSSDPLGEFVARNSPKPKELQVRNGNGSNCFLSYRLNFVDMNGGSDKIIAFHDPIIGNQNGGIDD